MSVLRHVKTTQERRRWFADVADVVLRASRNPRNLPSLWDDQQPHRQRNWKRWRLTKWRRPVEM
jgi:hypothetical protein